MDDSEVNRVIESVFRYDNVGGMRTGASQIYARSDMGNAERFIDAFGDKLRYNHDSSEWYVWNGKYWEQDSKGKVVELAKEAVRRIYDEARNIDDPNQKRDLLKFALQSESNKSLKNMLTVAETSPKISITIKELDSEKVLLNLNNGTYDLKRDAFFEHSAEDNISKLAPVDYDAKSVCPQWLESLDLIFNCNQALIEYIQRAVGYSLSGDVSEQVLFFAHGTGKNGKSVFFETMKMLLGDFWQKAPTEMLMMKKNQSSGIPNDVARLQGARFVVASEVPEGGRLNEARIKDLTGGDTLVARFMHKEFFEFSPTHKLWIYGNYKPIVTGTNEGIWRRLQLIPFKVTIPDSRKREMSEILSIYKSELPGILNWAIEGWRKYRKDGLKPPDEVSAATSTYRSEMDVIGDFIRECCEEGKGQSILAVELYRAYRTWAENNGEMPVGGRRFIAAIQERGFERVKASGNQFVWLGIGLRGNQVPAPVPIDPSEPNPEETLDDPCADFPKD
jgi:putative DNA primase/helicase